MKQNQIIYGGMGAVVLIGGAFFFLTGNKTPNIPQNVVTNQNQSQPADVDIFKGSLLPQSEIDKIKKNSPAIVQYLGQQHKTTSVIKSGENTLTFVNVPQQQIPQNVNPRQANYSGLSVVSLDVDSTNKKLAELKKESDAQYKQMMETQKADMLKMYKEFSNPNFGNDIKVPEKELAFFKNMKQTEFDDLMKSLSIILPTYPNKPALEKQIKEYKDYYAKLQTSLNNKNVTYGMLLQSDAQHKKIVQQISQIHNSFVKYTNNLYINQINKEETDAEFQAKYGAKTPPSKDVNPSAAKPTNQPMAPPNPSAVKTPVSQNTPNGNGGNSNVSSPNKLTNQNSNPANSNPTGNAFR